MVELTCLYSLLIPSSLPLCAAFPYIFSLTELKVSLLLDIALYLGASTDLPISPLSPFFSPAALRLTHTPLHTRPKLNFEKTTSTALVVPVALEPREPPTRTSLPTSQVSPALLCHASVDLDTNLIPTTSHSTLRRATNQQSSPVILSRFSRTPSRSFLLNCRSLLPLVVVVEEEGGMVEIAGGGAAEGVDTGGTNGTTALAVI